MKCHVKTRNNKEIIIDAEKFIKYSKKHVSDEQKSIQLVSLVKEVKKKGINKIVGEYKGLLDQVIEADGYKNYIQQERYMYYVLCRSTCYK